MNLSVDFKGRAINMWFRLINKVMHGHGIDIGYWVSIMEM